MRYFSTRGGIENGVTFERALTTGYAPDGGLYVPERLPCLTQADLQDLSGLSYRALAARVVSWFTEGEIDEAEVRAVVDACYKDFPEEIVSFAHVEEAGTLSYSIAELFRGPTHCFKDLSVSVAVGLLGCYCSKAAGGAAPRRHTILASTSGDTGPAVARAVNTLAHPAVRAHIFFPSGQVSRTQMLQMTTSTGPSVRVSPYEGGGDDMDGPIKQLQADAEFAARYGVMGCNSYNIARPVVQAVHYFWTYFRVVDEARRRGHPDAADGAFPPLTVVIPVGAMGNITGGTMARLMGLPLAKFVAGTNANDITHRVINRGEFHRAEAMVKTMSDAINVQVPYNFERILYYTYGCDAGATKAMMQGMERTGKLTLNGGQLETLRQYFDSARVDDDAMVERLKDVYERKGYLACPHSAVALDAAHRLGYAGAEKRDDVGLVAVFATASPCKFFESVSAAVGEDVWKQYFTSDAFPASARYLDATDAQERPAMEYSAAAGGSLEDSQAEWEARLRTALAEWYAA
eukprot:TRINITY_DN8640_c0_g1_i1.p1 TRINITY_DN8640_c0_g1~~TRINITY_DN8640_c0_g1_i1.p1  ORF type:complete len:553 (+),score=174.39 TRINITY_DN8640_c0_g1_i1:103-1659(+)